MVSFKCELLFSICMSIYFSIIDIRKYVIKILYEGQSKITEPYLITFESSKIDIYLDDISL